MTKMSVFGLLMLSFVGNLKSQNIDSAIQYYSTVSSSIQAITEDKEGNLFVAGYFTDSIFLKGIAIKGSKSTVAMFISSFSSTGSFRFSQVLYTNTQEHISLKTDDSGNLFVGSLFSGTVYLDPANTSAKIIAGANLGSFVAKYNKNGEYKWHTAVRSSGTNATVKYFDFVLRNNNQVYWMISAKGNFIVSNTRGSSTTFTGVGDESIGRFGVLIVMSNTDTYSAVNNSARIGSTSTTEAFALVEYNGKLVFSGKASSTVDFDPSGAKYELTFVNHGYYCCLDSNLGFVWAKKSNVHTIYRLANDAYGRIRGFGNYGGTGSSNMEFVCLSYNGDINWEYSEFFSSGYHYISDLFADRAGNVFVTGDFNGTGDFDPTSSTMSGYGGTRTAFLVKYDSSCAASWLITGSSASAYYNAGRAIHLSANNQLRWGGAYSRTFVFSGNSNIKLPYTTSIIGFMAHLTECKDFKPKISPSDTLVCYNQPVKIKISGAAAQKWLDNSDTSNLRSFQSTESNKYFIEASDAMGCYQTLHATIQVNPKPKPKINISGNKVSVNGNWSSIEWYQNGQLQSGQNNTDFYPSTNGKIFSVVKDSLACMGNSDTVDFNINHAYYFSETDVKIEANLKEVRLSHLPLQNCIIVIFDLNGRRQFDLNKLSRESEITIDHQLAPGNYLVCVYNSEKVFVRQLVGLY